LLPPHGQAFYNLRWASDAPPPERLKTEWLKVTGGYLRITDQQVYLAQMRRLVGLD
jgi:hypothetical protein